jgi:hypothetical protein
MLRQLAVSSPSAGDLVAASCLRLLTLLERSRLRARWRRLLDDLLSYWYWRGAGEALAGEPLDTVRRPPPVMPAQAFEVDLQIGLDAAIKLLDHTRPESLRLRWGELVVGEIEPHPGAEPLQGRHLRGLLRERFAKQFAAALARADALRGEGAGKAQDRN